jgi:hypothetical protein
MNYFAHQKLHEQGLAINPSVDLYISKTGKSNFERLMGTKLWEAGTVLSPVGFATV